jgi:L-fuconolactonase
MTHKIIDSHHHLWRYDAADYPWMSGSMEKLRRDYLLPDLKAVTQAAGVTGTVVVQARQTMDETIWLAKVAADTQLILGIVGWAPLIHAQIDSYLERLAALPKMKGMRHVLHDEPDPFYMSREDFHRGISRLKDYGLRFDCLIFESHLPQTIELVDRHPNQIFIVDHIAKPSIRQKALDPWRQQLTELASRPNVYCKLSGVVTEAHWDLWTEQELTPYFETVLKAFGCKRTMFGSDWPVVSLAASYGRWLETVQRALSQFSEEERAWIFAGTAVEAYNL